MTRNELIFKAWSDLGYTFLPDELDEFGWLNLHNTNEYQKFNCSIVGEFEQKGYNPFKTSEDSGIQEIYIRPRRLEGLEHNNGWNRIDGVESLPKKDYHLNYHFDPDFIWSIRIDGFKSIILTKELTHDNHSHWKPIKSDKTNPVH